MYAFFVPVEQLHYDCSVAVNSFGEAVSPCRTSLWSYSVIGRKAVLYHCSYDSNKLEILFRTSRLLVRLALLGLHQNAILLSVAENLNDLNGLCVLRLLRIHFHVILSARAVPSYGSRGRAYARGFRRMRGRYWCCCRLWLHPVTAMRGMNVINSCLSL